MKKIIVLMFTLSLLGCKNGDGSDKTTYSSCKITKSSAVLASDRDHDLRQCWNAPGNGYESKGDALQWCKRTVNSYMASRYVLGHSVEFTVESTYCPK